MQRKGVLALLAHRLGLFAGLIAGCGRDTVQIVRLEHQRVVVVLGEDILSEFHRRQRQLAVDGLQAGFLFGVEQRPGAHELAVGLLQQTALFGVEFQRGAAVIDGLHPLEELFVQEYLVGMRRQQRHHLLLQGLHPFVGFGGAEHAENQLGLREHLPRIVVGEDDVLERRRVVVRRDGVDLGVVQRHAALQSGQEMRGNDPVERRHPVGSVPLGEKGIFAHGFIRLAGGE